MSWERQTGEVQEQLSERASLYLRLASDPLVSGLIRFAELLLAAFRNGRKMVVFGNGGSAAEAQHFAAELVCQFRRARKALPAIALTTDSSILTAQGNDFGFASVFARQVHALCQIGDVAVALTTSDVRGEHSADISAGLEAARVVGAITVLLCSQKTHDLLPLADVALIVPDGDTARIQEVHLAIIHIVSGLVEEELT